MKRNRPVILIVDDQLASVISLVVEKYVTDRRLKQDFEIVSFSKIEHAREFISKNYGRIALIVFDSAFDMDETAGCKLYEEITRKYSTLKSRTLFFTAFVSSVVSKLLIGKAGEMLDPQRLVEKSVRSGERDLVRAMEDILEGNANAART